MFVGEDRRDALQVYSDILEVCRGGAKTTEVIRYGNVNTRQFVKSSELLIENGLLARKLEEDDGRTKYIYKATEKGLAFVNLVKKCYALLKGKENPYGDIPCLNNYPYNTSEAV